MRIPAEAITLVEKNTSPERTIMDQPITQMTCPNVNE